jgi:TRAP transporter TAXI family solute receptor
MSTVGNAKQGLVVCLVVSLTLLIAACSKEKMPSFDIGTGGVGGSYFAVGSALAIMVNKNRATNGFQLQNKLSSGSVSNINAIAAGDSPFGIAQADHQYEAVKGLGDWSERGPQDDLRAIFSMYTESVTLVVGADSGIRSIDDLKGKDVDIGSPGSGTRRNAIDALRAAGIDWKKDIQAREEAVDDRLAKFMRGELDAFFYTVGHPNKDIKFATLSVRGARIIPLSNIDSLITADSYFSRSMISANLYPMANNAVDIDTIGVNATLLTSAKVSEDVVYAVTKSVFENIESVSEFNAPFNALADDKFLEGLTAPIHPGALRYYREVGVHVPSP